MDVTALLRSCLLYIVVTVNGSAVFPRLLGSFNISHPGFVTLARNTSELEVAQSWNLIVSRFNGIPFSHDFVSIARGVGRFLQQPSLTQKADVTDEPTWPNEAAGIPDFVFGRPNLIIVPSGFLVPFKGNGALTIFDLDETEVMTPNQITSDNGWFYHRVLWLDMDSDGLLDAVTCKAQKPLIGNAQGSLLWLKQPSTPLPWKTQWTETVISSGEGSPDVFLLAFNATINGDTKMALITMGFFSHSLDIWWRLDESKPWLSDNVKNRVIDNTQGPAFDGSVVDVNGDGRLDLLVTYNKALNGTMIVYEMPDDTSSGTFMRHKIIDGLNPAKAGIGKGAPGGATAVFATTSRGNVRKPDILLSGDDNGKAYLLQAESQDPKDWAYSVKVILDATPGTVGQLAVGDVNGDGFTDFYIPAYDIGSVTAYTYSPDI